jgi:tRNA nucleotidyltransferase (CCA-adding enzyme)
MKMSADPVLIRRQLNRFGEEAVRQLIAVHAADEKAKGTVCPEDADLRAREITEALDRILAESACFSLAALAVKGGDLIALGMRPGKRLGETLQRLLEAVMEDRVPNEREALLSLAGQLLDPTAEDPRERQEE